MIELLSEHFYLKDLGFGPSKNETNKRGETLTVEVLN